MAKKKQKFNASKLKITTELKYLIAMDMFDDRFEQFFDAKTGKYLGLLGPEIMILNRIEDIDNRQEPEETDPNQLNLF